VPPFPPDIDCTDYDARIAQMLAEGRLKQEGLSCAIADVRLAKGGVYIDIAYLGDTQQSYHPRSGLAEHIAIDEDFKAIEMEWSPGEPMELLDWDRRISGIPLIFGTVYPPSLPYFVCTNSDVPNFIIQVIPLRTKGRALVPGTYRVRLTEKYTPYWDEEGATYVDHDWAEVTVE
jgi:hypothetical protein